MLHCRVFVFCVLVLMGCAVGSDDQLLPIPVDALDMQKSFSDDTILAHEKYAGKYVQTTIQGFSHASNDRAVTIETDTPYDIHFTCLYGSANEDYQEIVDSLREKEDKTITSESGHTVTLRYRAEEITVAGTVQGLDDQYSRYREYSIVISDCEVQE